MSFQLAEAFVAIEAEVDDKQVENSVSRLPSLLGPAAAAAGVAVGAALGAAIAEGIEQEMAEDVVGASLGLSEDEAETAGDIAGRLYSDAYGDSVGEVNEVVGSIMRQARDASAEEVEGMTEDALTMAEVWGVDINEAIGAATQLVDTGMAPTMSAAFDTIAGSMRDGQAPADEMLASIQEYSPVMASLGLDADDMYQVLTDGSVNTAREVDKAGDAYKELSLRATDGSDSTAEALDNLGLSQEEVNAAYAAGGEEAADMTERITGSLADMEDPILQHQTGVALMGTPYEDLGDQAPGILASISGDVEDLGDVTGDAAGQAFDNIGTGFTGSWRTLKQTLVNEVWPRVQPILSDLMGWIEVNLPLAIDFLKEKWKEIRPGVMNFIDQAKELGEKVLPVLVGIFEFVSENILPGFIEMVEAVVGWLMDNKGLVVAIGAVIGIWQVLTALMAVNPFVLIIGAVVLVASLIISNWDKILSFLSDTWDTIKRLASGVGDWLKEKFGAAVEFVKDLFLNFTPLGLIIKHFDKIKELATGVKDWIVDKFNDAVDFFKDLPSRITTAVSGMWDGIKSTFKGAINWIIDRWNDFQIILGGQTVDLPFGQSFDIPKIVIDTPNIPRLAAGGIATSPMVAAIAEGGSSEAVIPLNSRGVNILADAMSQALRSTRIGGVEQSFSLSEDAVRRPDAQVLMRQAEWRQKTAGI